MFAIQNQEYLILLILFIKGFHDGIKSTYINTLDFVHRRVSCVHYYEYLQDYFVMMTVI